MTSRNPRSTRRPDLRDSAHGVPENSVPGATGGAAGAGPMTRNGVRKDRKGRKAETRGRLAVRIRPDELKRAPGDPAIGPPPDTAQDGDASPRAARPQHTAGSAMAEPVPLPGPFPDRTRLAPAILPDVDPDDDAGDVPVVETGAGRMATWREDTAATLHPTPGPEGALRTGTTHTPAPGATPAGESVFVFDRRAHPAVSSRSSRQRPSPEPLTATPRRSPPATPLQEVPPTWMAHLARHRAGGSSFRCRQRRERTGFQRVHRITFGEKWYDMAVVTFGATPLPPYGPSILEPLRDFEMATWIEVLNRLANAPPPPYPAGDGQRHAGSNAVREPLLALPKDAARLVFPLEGEEGTAGYVRPFVPWLSLADAGVADERWLEASLRALLRMVRDLPARSGPEDTTLRQWTDQVVEPQVVLDDLARWSAGRSEGELDRLTGHHFLIYAPMTTMIASQAPPAVALLPTQWRLLHRRWRHAFIVQED